jgi:hypothetical protein
VIGTPCNMKLEIRNMYNIVVGNRVRTQHLGDMGVDKEIILKEWILKLNTA